jgi:peptide/nickel transport system substrate-binding protein
MRRLSILPAVLSIAVLSTLVFVAGGLAASPSPAASPAPMPSAEPGKLIYKIGIAEDVDLVNPTSGWSSISWETFRLCYNFLTWYDKDYQPVPDLATKWEHSADGKVWTFHLRSGVKWSDGQPLTARDVAYTYNRIITDSISMYTSYLTNVTKVEAPDDHTVVITCSRPNAGMLALYIPILPEHIWDKVATKNLATFTNLPFVGSGPFTVAAVKSKNYVKLVKNPYYKAGFGVEPRIDAVYFVIYQTADGLIQDYKAGNLDGAVDIPASYYRILAGVPGTKTVAAPAIGFHELGFNCWSDPKSKGDPLLRDVRIRQAVNWAIDKDKITKLAMDGLAQPATTILSPVVAFWRYDVPADQQYRYDPAKARQILTAAGYIDRNGDGVREAANGKPLDFRLTALDEYPEDHTAAVKIVGYLRSVGIKLRLQTMAENTFTNYVYANADMDMYLWSWGGDIDPSYQLNTFTTSQILNNSDSQYSNPVYDKLFVEQQSAIDARQRQKIIDQMQAILYRDSPYVVMWYDLNIQAFRTDKWTGYVLVPPRDGAPFWNYLRDTYLDLRPKTGGASGSGGAPAWSWIVLAVVIIAIVAAIVVYVRRPRQAEVE